MEKNADSITVYVSKNGCTNWNNAYTFSDVDASWKPQRLYLDSSYAVSSFKVRFLMTSNGTNTFPGWYIDDIGIGAISSLNESFDAPASRLPAGAFTIAIGMPIPGQFPQTIPIRLPIMWRRVCNCFSHGFC